MQADTHIWAVRNQDERILFKSHHKSSEILCLLNRLDLPIQGDTSCE